MGVIGMIPDESWTLEDEAALLLEGIEEYTELFRLVWALNSRYPDRPNVAPARALVLHLLERGHVRILVESPWGSTNIRPATTDEVPALLEDERQWTPPIDYEHDRALIDTTELGEARYVELDGLG